jgi:hypothetical protein
MVNLEIQFRYHFICYQRNPTVYYLINLMERFIRNIFWHDGMKEELEQK